MFPLNESRLSSSAARALMVKEPLENSLRITCSLLLSLILMDLSFQYLTVCVKKSKLSRVCLRELARIYTFEPLWLSKIAAVKARAEANGVLPFFRGNIKSASVKRLIVVFLR